MINNVLADNNYKNTYPVPEVLFNHKLQNPYSFYIQVVGARGAGKSTFINNVMKRLIKASSVEDYHYDKAATGAFETTLEQQFIDITPLVQNLKAPYKNVFLVDQPGIGGRTILEAEYLKKFGPGQLFTVYMHNFPQCMQYNLYYINSNIL